MAKVLNATKFRPYVTVMSYYKAAEKAANRIIDNVNERFDELSKKADGLDQQLTDISKRVTQLSDELKGIETAVSAVKDKVGK